MEDLLQALDEILKLDFKQDTKGGSYLLEEPENPHYPMTIKNNFRQQLKQLSNSSSTLKGTKPNQGGS
jgi:hypothetical protein